MEEESCRKSRMVLMRGLNIISEPGGGVPPYMGCVSMCSAKWYGFLAVLFINIASILAILAFCNVTQVLNWVCFLEAKKLICHYYQ